MPTNSHAIDPEELMAYLDGELPVDRAAAAAEHLAHCRDCQAVAADLQSVSRRLMAWQVDTPESAMGGVFCEDGCHEIKPKYGMPKVRGKKSGSGALKESEAALHFK